MLYFINNMDYHNNSDKLDMVDMVLDMAHNTVDMDKMDVGLIRLLPKSHLIIHQQMVQQKILSDHSVGFDIHALALPPLVFIPFKQDCI